MGETRAHLTKALPNLLERKSVKSPAVGDMDARVTEGIEFAKEVFECCGLSHVDDRRIPIAVLIAGSGRGKTHYMEMLRRRALDEKMTPVFCTFNGDTSVGMTKEAMAEFDIKATWKFNYELAIRFMFSYYASTLPIVEMAGKAHDVHLLLPGLDQLLRAVVDMIAEDAKDEHGVARVILGTDETLELANAYGLEPREVEEAFGPLRRLSVHNTKVRVAVVQSALWTALVDATVSRRAVVALSVPETLPASDVLRDWLTRVAEKFPNDSWMIQQILTVCHNWPRALEVAGQELLTEAFAASFQGDDKRKRAAAVEVCRKIAQEMWERYLRKTMTVMNEAVLFHVIVPQLPIGHGQQSDIAQVDMQGVISETHVRQLVAYSIYVPTEKLLASCKFVPTMPPILLAMEGMGFRYPVIDAVFKELLKYPTAEVRHRGTLLETVCARWLWFIGRCALERKQKLVLGNVFLDVIGGPAIEILLQEFQLNVNLKESIGVRQLPGILASRRHLAALAGESITEEDMSKQVQKLQEFRRDFKDEAEAFKEQLELSGAAAKQAFDRAFTFAEAGATIILTEGDPLRSRLGHYRQSGFDIAVVGTIAGELAVLFLEPHRVHRDVDRFVLDTKDKLRRVEELMTKWSGHRLPVRAGLLMLTDEALREKAVEAKLGVELEALEGIALGIADFKTLHAFLGPWGPLYEHCRIG